MSDVHFGQFIVNSLSAMVSRQWRHFSKSSGVPVILGV